ncbi:MAG: DUF3987 domain-containing protein [Acidimicrobiia bacterium]
MTTAAQAALFGPPTGADPPAWLPAAPAPDGWPAPPDPAAFTGLAGEVVDAVAPHTEADPIAILTSLLVGFGSLVGPDPRYQVGATAHRANEFVVLVGPSSAGRKGTSWDAIEVLLGAVDRHWATERVVSGLSSGEGLIWHLRDRDDGGLAPDRRLLVLEAEFASVLKAAARDQNTLSPVIRNAWDHRVLQVITKHDPSRASDAHVAIIGHITADELVRHVGATEIANGFLNRFLLVCVRRSRLLPEGGQVNPATLATLAERLAQAASFASWADQVTLDETAKTIWWDRYPALSAGRPGMWGAATARAEAHVVRLALIYALLDRKARINPTHLQAALAVWDYTARSTLHVFGDNLGDPIADEIRRALTEHPDGLTRTELRDLFSRNRTRAEISRALDLLGSAGLAQPHVTRDRGRPVERWTTTTP